MKRAENIERWIAFSAVVLLLVPGLALGDDEVETEGAEVTAERPADETEGWLHLGLWSTDLEGNPLVPFKYEPDDGDNVDVGLDLSAIHGGTFVGVEARVRSSDDQKLDLTFEAGGRTFRSRTTWDSFPVQLAHDPLTNLVAATDHGRVVEHTDLDPGRRYGIDWSRLEHRSEFQHPDFPALTLGFGYRMQERSGEMQARTVSHCGSCHVYSQTRPIDEKTEDISLDATVDLAKAQLRASWSHRELDEGVQAISLLYDDALHPEQQKPLFDNRLQWDSAEGPQAVAQRPDSEKDTIKLALDVPRVGGFDFGVTGVWSTTENTLTGVESDYTGYLVDATRQLGNSWRLRWRHRAYSLDADEFLVQLNERVGVAGPQAGATYSEIYGIPESADYIRYSTLDRDVLESRLELAWKISKEAGTLRFMWDFEDTDRDHIEVAPNEGSTTENVLGLAWSARPVKGLRLFAKLRHGEVYNPFANLNGTYSTFTSGSSASPFGPDAAQYFEFQGARIADPSAYPETWDEAQLRLSKTFGQGRSVLSASYRYKNGENDSLDLGDWERTNQAVSVSMFQAVDEHVRWHVAWAHHESEVNFPNNIPIFDG